MGKDSTALGRRKVLKRLGATATVAGLAGCGSQPGGDTETQQPEETEAQQPGGTKTQSPKPTPGNQLGERVPPIVVQFLPGFGPWGDATELIVNDIKEAIDHEIVAEPVEIAAFLEAPQIDDRSYHYQTWGWFTQPTNFDPGRTLRGFAIDNAGAKKAPNWGNYADCEFSKLIIRQLSIGDEAERREFLEEAQSIYSEDRVEFSIVSNDSLAAGRKDVMNFNSLGIQGININNPKFFRDSTSKTGNRWVFGTSQTLADTKNHLKESSTASAIIWHQLIHSPLFIFDENRERQPELAEDFTVSDNGQEITFHLADATFHNGDPVTSEDVKFTLEFIQEKDVPLSTDIPFDSINTPDDSTVEITLENPSPLFLTIWAGVWGILHKDTWEGVDTVSDYEPSVDEVIGSGPFQLADFSREQSVVLEPNPHQHPHDVSHDLVFIVYSDNQTKTRALRNNEIQVAGQLTGSDLNRLSDQMSDDTYFENVSKGIGAWKLIGANSRDPIFRDEFADAVAMSVNREQINQVVFDNRAKEVLHSGNFLLRHPFSPPEEDLHFYTDDPTGDQEGARQRLRDAGWGWDDNGNLRYPADVDPAPLWPKGETPSPEDYPCLNENGEVEL